MLLHAAAGGIGLIACQWARHLGATIIGTVSTADKAELAKAHGCTHVINYKTEDFVKRTKELTNGQGVDVVYDARRQGYLSGLARLPEAARPVGQLRQRLGRHHQLRHLLAVGQGLALRHAADARHLRRQARRPARQRQRAVRRGRRKGIVKINVNHTYPLKDAAQAHRDLEGRKTTGSIVLLP